MRGLHLELLKDQLEAEHGVTLVDRTEAQQRLGVCEQSLRNWDQRGLTQPIRQPGSRFVFYTEAAIQRLEADKARLEARRAQRRTKGHR